METAQKSSWIHAFTILQNTDKNFFFLKKKTLFALGGSPTPHPISSQTSFLYVNLVAMGPVHLSPVTWPQALRYWYSLTPLMHIVAQLRPIDLHNDFKAKYQRVVSFWVPVNYPSLNELVSMPGPRRTPTQFRFTP
jgi:hypothetical protein